MRVAVAGAGDTGQSIARSLLHAGHEVLLIERYRAAYRPSLVPGAEWLFADACELDALKSAGIDSCDAVIAACGDDKVNLVFALLCKTEFAVPRVVARINNPDHRELFTQDWGVDVAVGSADSLIATADELGAGGTERLSTVLARTRLIEFTVGAGSPADGSAAGALPLPKGAAVLAVIRGQRLLPFAPAAPLRAGDNVLVLASADAEPGVHALGSRAPEPADNGIREALHRFALRRRGRRRARTR